MPLLLLLVGLPPTPSSLRVRVWRRRRALGAAVPLKAYFFKVGAFTFGGGLTMIAFIQDQVVEQFHWLTAREFIDGLALGQFTPGPMLMVAAYVGYKIAEVAGAAVATGAIFLPSFILMLTLLPMLDRVRRLTWMRAAMNGMGPAVIGWPVRSSGFSGAVASPFPALRRSATR